ncbi:hypothetical protein [Streptomyces sp. NPDC005374]|uniref:hypothetical protein n=1 Tax=Streptomyces sp. NPDC005374 TaxID=3364713 RepID=UPI0036817ED0
MAQSPAHGIPGRPNRGRPQGKADELIQLATEQDDLDELRRLVARGSTTAAAEQLAELTPD